MNEETGRTTCYDDIIDLPHHQSATRPHTPVQDRAAQFSPFAALTGYEDAVKETARQTQRRIELDEDSQAKLNARLQLLLQQAAQRPEITVTYFRPDAKKEGGAYVEAAGRCRRVDACARVLQLTDGARIPIGDIVKIEGALFRALDDCAAD